MSSPKTERIAKVIARSGLCSRRDAERWIGYGRVSVNGKVLTSAALNVTPDDTIEVDGNPLPERDRTRLWLYHKPRGLVVSTRDGRGRQTVFETLPKDLPRLQPVGRLDINTEGLLLLTNDGGLKRVLELPSTGWLRRYRVRVHGKIKLDMLDKLKEGMTVDGVHYGPIHATIDREKGANAWLTMVLREGKNREIKVVLEAFDLQVTRLIRVSYGPFQLADLAEGDIIEVRGRYLRDQLGQKLANAAQADFQTPIVHSDKPKTKQKKNTSPSKVTPPQGKRPTRLKPGQMPEAIAHTPSRPKSKKPRQTSQIISNKSQKPKGKKR